MHPDEMEGQVLGHYRLLKPLGYGGTATVFLAEDIHLEREVAIKIYRSKEGETRNFLRRFAREARVLAKLDHPNILPVYDYGELSKFAYLVMPHMAGGSLRDRLNKTPMLAESEAVALISQILGALQYAHDQGLIHRDIKPGNMLFKTNNILVLSDFGLVKLLPIEGGIAALEETSTLTEDMIVGTPDYMAPEQIDGQVMPATDIYAIGAVLYEMLAGRRLFTADGALAILMKHIYEQPQPLHKLNSIVSPEIEAIIMRALTKDAGQRYQRPDELRQALEQALAHRDTHTEISEVHDLYKTIPVTEPPIVETDTVTQPPNDEVQKRATIVEETAADEETKVEPQSELPSDHTALSADIEQFDTHSNADENGEQAKVEELVTAPVVPWKDEEEDKLTALVTQAIERRTLDRLAAFREVAIPANQLPATSLVAPAVPQQQMIPLPASTGLTQNYQQPIAIATLPLNPQREKRSSAPLLVTLILIIVASITALGGALYAFLAIASKNTNMSTPPILNTHITPTTQSTQVAKPGATARANRPTSSHTPVAVVPNQPTADCPSSSQQAHKAFMDSLASGTQQNLVYLKNQGSHGALLRHAIEANTQDTIIQQLPDAIIKEAQVSNDGQWLLFVAAYSNHQELRLIRMDGQEMQTLYCTPNNQNLSSSQWSINQQYIIFNVSARGVAPTTYLLDTTSGQLQTEIASQANPGYIPLTWVTNSLVYLTAIVPGSNAAPQDLYLLDIHKGPDQNSIPRVMSGDLSCKSFDTSTDSTQLFVSNCLTSGSASTITDQPIMAASGSTIYTSNTLSIQTIRVIDKSTLMLQVENQGGVPGVNGLYTIYTDGHGIKLLTPDSGTPPSLCAFSQYVWSNFSRDHTLFATATSDPTTKTNTLYTGSLKTGTVQEFVQATDGSQFAIVGWTKM